jgi:hypothetical protein
MFASLDVRRLIQTHRAKTTATVFDLAKKIAREEDVDPDLVIRTTELSGMSDEDFFDLVDMVRTRDELRRVAATANAHRQELATIQAAIRGHKEKLDAAEKAYRQAVSPLAAQEEGATSRLGEAERAAGSLLDPRNLPRQLVDELEAAKNAAYKSSNVAREKELEADREAARAAAAAEKLDRQYGGADKAVRRLESGELTFANGSEQHTLATAVRGGRYREKTAREELTGLLAARDAAVAEHARAQKAAADF